MAIWQYSSAEQIVAKLRQIGVQLAQGKSLALACSVGWASFRSRAAGRVLQARDFP